ncbi:putative membrane protein [Escherichia coli 2865200]|nr:putative membrane protein [Escherichia coli 2865200]
MGSRSESAAVTWAVLITAVLYDSVIFSIMPSPLETECWPCQK